MSQIGPYINGQECEAMEFEDDEFIKTLEVSYQPTVVNSVAVVTDKGNFKRWGINNGEIKTWNFSS